MTSQLITQTMQTATHLFKLARLFPGIPSLLFDIVRHQKISVPYQ